MHYSYYPYPVPYREDPVLIRNLQKAINGEFSAIQCYRKLPKTRSGKIMRRVLKAWELNLPAGDLSTMED